MFFTVTFDQFNAFLMNKSINTSILINFTPNFWLVVYHIFHKTRMMNAGVKFRFDHRKITFLQYDHIENSYLKW